MEVLLALGLALVAAGLCVLAIAPLLRRAAQERRGAGRRRARRRARLRPDEIAAEAKAEELLATVVGAEGLEAYRALGFLYAFGDPEADGQPGYGYLIYPHRPIVSFDARSGRLLNELCVSFPDGAGSGAGSEGGERLPDADDVLAKWMAIRGDELGLLAAANLHPPGRQVDPDQARRDIVRLADWTASPSDAGAPGGFATAQ